MFKQFKEHPSAFEVCSRRHQAECMSKLWSHIDNVFQRSTRDGQVLGEEKRLDSGRYVGVQYLGIPTARRGVDQDVPREPLF